MTGFAGVEKHVAVVMDTVSVETIQPLFTLFNVWRFIFHATLDLSRHYVLLLPKKEPFQCRETITISPDTALMSEKKHYSTSLKEEERNLTDPLSM